MRRASNIDRRTFVKGATVFAVSLSAFGVTACAPSEDGKGEGQEADAIEADIVVIGAGGSGLTAAASAAAAGKKVVVVEKLKNPGGSAALSAGAFMIWAPAEGQYPEFTADDLYDFWMEKSENKSDPKLVRKIADMSTESYEWIESHGIDYTRIPSTVPSTPDLPIMTAGSEAVLTVGNGKFVTEALYQDAVDNNVEFYFEHPATALLLEDGKAVGVVCEGPRGTTQTFHASRIVLATGSFDAGEDNEVKKTYAPHLLGISSQSSPGNTGDGILMAAEAGCALRMNGGAPKGNARSAGSNALPAKNSLIIDENGKRFIREDCFYADLLYAMIDNGSTKFYQVFDATCDEKVKGYVVDDKLGFTAATPEELAKQIGCDTTTLSETVARYNELCSSGTDTDFEKDGQYLIALQEGDLFALECFPSTNGTMGGVSIDENGQVLSESGTPVEGLYACGDNASGSFFYKKYPGSGSTMQFAVSSARIAVSS